MRLRIRPVPLYTFPDVIRDAQEIVELVLKGMLRAEHSLEHMAGSAPGERCRPLSRQGSDARAP